MQWIASPLRRSLGSLHPITRANALEISWDWITRMELGAGCCCSNYVTSTSGFQGRYSASHNIMKEQGHMLNGQKARFQPKREDEVIGQIERSDRQPLHRQVGKNISSADKRKFLINTLLDLKDSKEAVYGTLDAWVAWEQKFPLASLKQALIVLEKEEQWHRVVQVVKWMLSKGQGTTMGTYEQLIRALEKDHRAEEAHNVWVKKISHDLHSVPWRFCDLMLSIYYRNNMLDRLVKLFKGLESYDRKPPTKSIVRKVADAYELLGLSEEKNKLLGKYSHLFDKSPEECAKKSRKVQKGKRSDVKTVEDNHKKVEALDDMPVDSGPSDVEVDAAA
ncbi:pentatricopeptide repeat-containing protein At4g18975, chloroplastic isoform X1 [Typha angustifolia]|uniref:pentatricopeptide repeat-containing protein At4g18975, chloroplastic isoform X1 n=2 Tax=Typha angustifolia TaxID=59011 RepID=UPI003C301CC5